MKVVRVEFATSCDLEFLKFVDGTLSDLSDNGMIITPAVVNAVSEIAALEFAKRIREIGAQWAATKKAVDGTMLS